MFNFVAFQHYKPKFLKHKHQFVCVYFRTGEIYFFDVDPSGNQLQLDPALTLKGEAFGAGFGYSLATLDANGDKSPGRVKQPLIYIYFVGNY